MVRTIAVPLAVAAAVAAIAAASSAASPRDNNPPIVTRPSSQSTAADAWQALAVCLSKQTGRRVTVGAPPVYGVQVGGPPHPYGSAADAAAFRARLERAGAVCGRFLRPVQGNIGSAEFEAKFRDAMLAVARCMRRHDINVGDPLIRRHLGGGYTVKWPAAPGVQTSGPRWNRAYLTCRSFVTSLFEGR